ncbi:hypothetical protein [Ancylobacter mangrovi]|uniref:hypothetical protein n=1 Tax=Ancylobacter mangrovi TaxID=2972472 RepID=UPI0021629209|nr:hypothetical protein [Ancylobacter mangrovi]MCS0500972.1 hypothetical protein [Ancylobacter mangrovi]
MTSGANGVVAGRECGGGGADVYLGTDALVDAGENGVVSQSGRAGGFVNMVSGGRIIADQSRIVASNEGGSANVVSNNLTTAGGSFGAAATTTDGDASLQVSAAIDGSAQTGAIVEGDGNARVDINASVDALANGVLGKAELLELDHTSGTCSPACAPVVSGSLL